MNNHMLNGQASWRSEIDAIVAAYSLEENTDIPSAHTMLVLQDKTLLKILDETSPAGPGKLSDVVAVCRELGKVDASLSWLVGVANAGWSMKANFSLPESVCAAMDKNAILSMVLGRPGTLEPAPKDEGWILNGEWKYASGYPWSSYFFGLAMSDDGHVRVVVVPSDDLHIIAPWQSTGLIGTQSVTIRAHDVYVPEVHTVDYQSIISGESFHNHDKPSYSGYFTGVLMNCLVGSMLGATEGAMNYVIENIQRPIAGSMYASMDHSDPVRCELGRLSSAFDLLIRAAEYNASVIDDAVYNGTILLTNRQRVEIRARATQIMRGCTETIQSLLWLYGSSGLEKSCPLEKIWRDINVGARHGGFAKLVPEELAGIVLLGGDPTTLSRMF
ncbi:hypothetical protein KKJ01_16165 [Xenorhabdus bovienii]|uniref:Acyl-CoA dehydrogenase C-terminal domain-containing protein n=1 Tax=Xenorhabdus bovienii TaxID=40576 RepID=A0AAJ1J9Q3_XENBV|nr:hypothetical protein [Xenorhabdus bovienii]MDE1479720.1 hypothetical protein [Xenorhabdus bovienii]MDE1491163.1 hypothetical protein [Xenorhabdus bovienii]MDE9511539.1 hypothetical protein [Xenorhabdus bovienii]MDE9523168.1 hypothetical protein [Xenorhabdus bovienii]